MYIFIDTNIYFNNWLLKSPPFAKFIHYCNETNATLLLPEVVAEEVQAKYGEELAKLFARMENDRRQCENFGYSATKATPIESQQDYNFVDIVKHRFHFVEWLSLDNVPHRSLVKKAINAKRPFTDSEKGYRDALIWQTLLIFLKSSWADSSVAFITDNLTDFFDGKEAPLAFHEDLRTDLREADIKNRFQLYRNLRSFVDTNKIVQAGLVDQERLESELLPAIEEAAEIEAIKYLNSLSLADVKQLFAEANFDINAITHVQRVDWVIMEGTEDPDIGKGEALGNDAIFIPYEFNLRNLDVTWEMSTASYYQNKSGLDSLFINIDVGPTTTSLSTSARCYFQASFIVQVSDGDVVQGSIDSAWLRPYR